MKEEDRQAGGGGAVAAPGAGPDLGLSPGSGDVPAARQGRDLQRYGEGGQRLIAGCIPIRWVSGGGEGVDGVEVMMVSSRNGKGMLFPKGGWEEDETVEVAAVRECLEEGGVRGQITRDLGNFEFRSKQGKGNLCLAQMFVLEVAEVLDTWPESKERSRLWVSVGEAYSQCRHEWMRETLRRWAAVQGWAGAVPGVSNGA